MIYRKAILLSVITIFSITACESSDVSSTQSSTSLFSEPWNSGLDAAEADFQIQQIDPNTFAIRQSLHTTFEAPFLYLIFGADKVILIDTGVEGVDLRSIVDQQIEDWLLENDKEKISLIVAHSHAHGDHVGGDDGFSDRPDTVVVGHKMEDIAEFFEIDAWPVNTKAVDLGDRVVDILPTPGHHDSHIMIYDRTTDILFSGDTIYPGRIYFRCGNTAELKASIDRIANFSKTNNIRWVLGAHIEMTTEPGQSFQSEDRARQNEHALELQPGIINEMHAALGAMIDAPRVESFDEFVLFPIPADPRGKTPPDWCKADNASE
ncbi:MAG: MBL fold metallo-hydrolase [Alphaproteobacteria bacterium]|nr:MBL fold metallo-hydrolase [Alphaproteobacteria bacterium]